MIHIDGFEQFRNDGALSSSLVRADYLPGPYAITAVAGRGRLAAATALSGKNITLTRKHPFTGAQFSVGFAFTFIARGALATVTLGENKYTLWLDANDGLARINDTRGGALPTITRWYYYEIEVDRAAGVMRLFINNRLDIEHPITADLAGLTEASVTLGWRAPSEFRPPDRVDGDNQYWDNDDAVKTFDDLYLRDGDHIGPLMVSTRFPTNDKHVEWFLAATGGSHSASLALQPPKPLDNYVASDTIGQEERFNSGQELANDNPVIATGVLVLARKSPSLDAKLGVFIGGQAGAALREDDRTLESEWRTQYVCFEQVPGDTVIGVKQADFGFNVSST